MINLKQKYIYLYNIISISKTVGYLFNLKMSYLFIIDIGIRQSSILAKTRCDCFRHENIKSIPVTWRKFREIVTIKNPSKKSPPPGNFCFKMSSISHLVFIEVLPKGNQIIKNAWRITASDMNAIQRTVHKISHLQAFQVAIFSKCSSSAILFLMNSSQKLIRSSEIPREPA